MKQNKVATNLQQDFTAEEQAQARENIGINLDNLSDGSNVKFANALSEVDLSKADMKIYRDRNQSPTLDYSKLYIKNEYDNSKTFTLVDTDAASGYLFKLASGPIVSQEIQFPQYPEYEAGDGINFATNLGTGNIAINWDYTVGRNLHINQNDQIQTNFPGGVWDAPTNMSNNFTAITGSDFAGAYRLGCKYYGDKYQLAIIYTASGTTSSIQFIGTETVIGTDNSCTVNQAVYNESALYTPVYRFGYSTSTVFDPTVHKAIIYNGIGLIGPCSDCKIAIWNDNGTVKIGMTAIEVGKVGSTL